jgi:CRP/FNR family transcriptional activator FtrB
MRPADTFVFYQFRSAVTLLSIQSMMQLNEINAVRNLALFRGVSKKDFEFLMEGASLSKFAKGDVMIREGQMPKYLHLVVDGGVELFANFEDKETTLDIAKPGATFILAAVIRDEIYLKSARAVMPSSILMIPASAVRDVFGRDAAFARSVVNELALRYRTIVRALKNEKLRTTTERLANWISNTERSQGNRGIVELEYDKKTLASLLGMTPANLSRELAFLSEHGIAKNGRQIILTDRQALAAYARATPLIDG